MMRSIHFKNYRSFEEYALTGLSRVNLLVGLNNCGKSTVLEAVWLLATGGDPAVFAMIARQRGETGLGPRRDDVPDAMYADVSHFFFGHDVEEGTSLTLRAFDEFDRLVVNVGAGIEESDFGELDGPPSLGAPWMLRIDSARPESVPPLRVPVSPPGALLLMPAYRVRRRAGITANDLMAVQRITPGSVDPGTPAELWDRAVLEGREREIIDTLRILEPGLQFLHFLSADGRSRLSGHSGVLVALEDGRRLPLGSFGDGMRRLLHLALCLAYSPNHILLIDEIDTGLHYSIMADMWRVVVHAAEKANVQVFATTHSADCIRGLAQFCQMHPDLSAQVSLQKIDRNLPESVAHTSEEIVTAVDLAIETR
jgi:energy-coupling factor transporter ATP-binding protein EcfA2